MSTKRKLILSIMLLVVVFLIGTTGYVIIEDDVSITDAAYMTIITVSTVGFSETIGELSGAGRLWTALIIVGGVSAGSMAISMMVSMVIDGELRALRERTRMQSAIDNLDDHVIVCGFGRMGSMAVKSLVEQGKDVVVVENSEALSRELDERRFPYIIDDATEDEALLKAGIMRASILVATLPSDADNLYVAMSARDLRPDMRIIARAENPEAEKKLLRGGATSVVCPHTIGAMRIANLIARPHLTEWVEVAAKGVELEINEHVVGPQSRLAGKSLRQVDFRKVTRAMVVAIKRADGTTIFSPEPDDLLCEGDILVTIGTVGMADRMEAFLN